MIQLLNLVSLKGFIAYFLCVEILGMLYNLVSLKGFIAYFLCVMSRYWACLISINKVVNKHHFVLKHDTRVTDCCTKL